MCWYKLRVTGIPVHWGPNHHGCIFPQVVFYRGNGADRQHRPERGRSWLQREFLSTESPGLLKWVCSTYFSKYLNLPLPFLIMPDSIPGSTWLAYFKRMIQVKFSSENLYCHTLPINDQMLNQRKVPSWVKVSTPFIYIHYHPTIHNLAPPIKRLYYISSNIHAHHCAREYKQFH